MAEVCLIPFQPFVRLVQEITADVRSIPTVFGAYRWEKDALVCLQTFTEHILVMIFEMTYDSSLMTLITSNKIAIHAKRRTIMHHDMQLLRDLWKTIAPESAIGADSADTCEQNKLRRAKETHLKARQIQKMLQRVQHARTTGRLHQLSAGIKSFCRMHNIDVA